MPWEGAPLHLALHVGGVSGLADVQEGGCADDVHLARLRVHLYVEEVAGKRAAHAALGVHCGAGDGTAGGHQPARKLPEREAVLRVLAGDEGAVHEFDVLLLQLPQESGAIPHLVNDQLRSGDGRPARVEGDAAAAGAARPSDGVGVDYLWRNVLGGQAQNLGHLHGDCHAGPGQVH